MKVKELIALLQTCNPESTVEIEVDTPDGGYEWRAATCINRDFEEVAKDVDVYGGALVLIETGEVTASE